MLGPSRQLRRTWPGTAGLGADALLDLTVVVLASWTLVYHAALLLSLGSSVALGLEAVVLLMAAVGRRLLGPGLSDPPVDRGNDPPAAPRAPTAQHRRWAALTVGSAAVAAASMAVAAPWFLVWPCWLLAAGAGTWVAAGRLRGADLLRTGHREPTSTDAGTALGAALLAAGSAAVTLRSNPDDLFYVNFSQWIAEHGSFPLRDTLFSDQVFAAVNWPPLASYDGLVGAVAHLTGTYAGTWVYEVVPPVAAVLAVLALWRLLLAWRVRLVTTAMAAGLVFLLFDGTSSYASPGNLFVTRLWQGKVILLCVLVPVLLVLALRHVEGVSGAGGRSRRTTGWLFLGGVAAVGLSTSAIFLVPLLAVAGMAPLVRGAPRPALTGFLAMAGYPLACGAFTVAVGGRSADDFGSRRLFRFDPAWFGHQIFLTGLVALVGVLAVLVGPLLVPHPAARVTTGVLVLATGVTFVPGVTQLGYRLVGLGPTLWRVSWGCTVAALVGVAAAWLLGRLPRGPAVLAALLGVALLGVLGHPIWAPQTNTVLAWPPHWQRGAQTRATTARIIAASDPGDLVLAPSGLAITLVVTDTGLRSVAPRDYVLDRLRAVPSFHYADRRVLVDFVNDVGVWRYSAVDRALHRLGVDIACVSAEDVRRAAGLRSMGYRPLLATTGYRCLRR